MDHPTASVPYAGPTAQPPRLSVEAEASQMNRGRGKQLLWLGGGTLLLIAAGFATLQVITRGEGYSNAAGASAQLEREHFDAFFACALPDARASELSASRLSAALATQGSQHRKAYAQRLEGCMHHLQALDAGVRALKVPTAVRAQQAGLAVATDALAKATSNYSNYLAHPAQGFTVEGATPMVDAVGDAWAGYRAAQVSLEQALETHL